MVLESYSPGPFASYKVKLEFREVAPVTEIISYADKLCYRFINNRPDNSLALQDQLR